MFAMQPGTLAPSPQLPRTPVVAPALPWMEPLDVVEHTVASGRHGDVAFAIGTLKVRYQQGPDQTVLDGSYWRIWRRDGENWRLATGASQLE